MKKFIIILLLVLSAFITMGQTEWKVSRELILPRNIGICNNRFDANYYIGENYWANIYILIRVRESKPYLPRTQYQLNLRNDKYKIRLVDTNKIFYKKKTP